MNGSKTSQITFIEYPILKLQEPLILPTKYLPNKLEQKYLKYVNAEIKKIYDAKFQMTKDCLDLKQFKTHEKINLNFKASQNNHH